MATKTKKDIVDSIADKHKIKRSLVMQIVRAFLEENANSLVAGNRLEFRDFGVFEVREYGPRRAQNPRTLAPAAVPRRWRLRFKAGRTLTKRLNVKKIQASDKTNEDVSSVPRP